MSAELTEAMRILRDSGVGTLAVSVVNTRTNPRGVGGMMGIQPGDIEATAVTTASILVEREGANSWSDFNMIEGVLEAEAKKLIQEKYGI